MCRSAQRRVDVGHITVEENVTASSYAVHGQINDVRCAGVEHHVDRNIVQPYIDAIPSECIRDRHLRVAALEYE